MKQTKIYKGWIGWGAHGTKAGAFRTDAPGHYGCGDRRGWSEATLAVTEDIAPKTKTVYQWRYKNADQKHWKVAKTLLTRVEAEDYFLGCDIAPHGPAVEVSCDD